MRRITTRIISAAAVVAGVFFAAVSCEPEGITDTSEFTLYYPGITDIGPSTNFNLTPTYHGQKPSEFAIDKVTFENAAISSECFSIDAGSGLFSLQNTENLETGLYKISISCKSGSKRYSFEDIITINMMKAVPDGITVNPDMLKVKLGDIVSPEEGTVLPTAKISTDGSSVSIKKYIITNVRRDGNVIADADKLFSVSTDGIVSIIGDNPDFKPGKYVMDFKLTTYLVGENDEEGLFSDALSIDVTSEPLDLAYEPAETNVESGYGISSPAPVLTGSLDGIKYSFKSIIRNDTEPVSGAPFSIDETTGVISVADKNTLTIGDFYTVSVTAENAYGKKDFENVYKITVVDFIEPITELSYDNVTGAIQKVAFSNPVKSVVGESVTYYLENLPATLADLKINAGTGEVYAEKGHNLPLGTHTVTVKAKNIKSEITATFSIEIVSNPNMFTYVHWGNNLGLSPAENYASQYRFSTKDEMLSARIPVSASDLPENVEIKFEIDKANSVTPNSSTISAVSIDEKTGTITLGEGVWNSKQRVIMALVVITAGTDPQSQVSVKVPVFFEVSNPITFDKVADKIYLKFTPFVFQVNPRTGGASKAPEITGATTPDNFRMEFRTNFRYGNVNGPSSHISGVPKVAGGFMTALWDAFYVKINKPVNYGQKYPMSYFQGTKDGWLNTYALGYINCRTTDNPSGDFSVRINPGVWVDGNGNYANGVLIPEVAYSYDGSEPDKAHRNLPVAVWFDEKF